MKKLFMLFALISLVGATSLSAQKCCSKSKTASASCTKAAATTASLDADIEKRMSEETGEVSFVRKSVCAVSGKTSYTNVEYDAETKKFVNVSPTHTSGKAAKASCCSKDKAAGCSKKSASTTAVKKTSTAKVVKTSGTN